MIKRIGFIGLFLFSCSEQNHWAVDHIHSDKAEYSFAKISCPALDPVNGIDIEFVNNSDQVQAYLTVHSTPIEPLNGAPQSVAVSIRSSQEKFSCTAYRFQGGQKFLLPPEIAENIISLLKNKQEITILLNGYRTVLKPTDFEKKYETFLHSAPLRNPFQFSL